MGKRPAARQASPMWVETSDLPTSDGHPYFERLNRVLAGSGFDAFVEELCAAFYADRLGRPSLRPGRYFRMLFIGYFEGLSSERGIAWRVADSLSLRSRDAGWKLSARSGTRGCVCLHSPWQPPHRGAAPVPLRQLPPKPPSLRRSRRVGVPRPSVDTQNRPILDG